jgi:hypothetical protein
MGERHVFATEQRNRSALLSFLWLWKPRQKLISSTKPWRIASPRATRQHLSVPVQHLGPQIKSAKSAASSARPMATPYTHRRKASEYRGCKQPAGDIARKGAVTKRTQLKGRLMGKTAWTKRDKTDGQVMAVKKSKKKFKGVRREKRAR